MFIHMQNHNILKMYWMLQGKENHLLSDHVDINMSYVRKQADMNEEVELV